MLRTSFGFPDPQMPRTVFYDQLAIAISRLPGFTVDESVADLLFPREDTALETNWPRYARPDSALISGQFDPDHHVSYLQRMAGTGVQLCIINMNPFMRMPIIWADHRRVIVADNNLLVWERAMNPRTISMPSFPFTNGTFDPAKKQIRASFRGVLSHPCRQALLQIHDGTSVVVEMVDRQNHLGRIDALSQVIDGAYADLLFRSVFAFVPRGDAEFSYRLLEAMSFGCIPIVISDGWVLPFDRLINWDGAAIRIPENRISDIPGLLSRISPHRIETMQAAVVAAYSACFAGFTEVAAGLLAEAEILVKRDTA